jgi:tetratricopeptide (TPR) repeat protein
MSHGEASGFFPVVSLTFFRIRIVFMAGSNFSDMSGPALHAGKKGNAGFLRTILRTGLALALLLMGPALAVGQDRPETFDELAASAAAARQQNDIPRAMDLYQKAVQLNPKWPDGWWYLGSLQYAVNAYAASIEALTHYIELTPRAGPALALRGLGEFEQGQYPESLQDLQRGIALGAANQPRNTRIILYHEALLLTRLGRFEEALGKYTLFVKQGAINEDVTAGIGLSGLRMPIFPKDIDPSQAQLVSMTGRAAISVITGDLAGGHQAFLDIFHRFPTAPNAHYLYGYLLFSTDPDQAIEQFQQELTVYPSSAIGHAMLAWAYGLRGDFAAALPDAQKAAAEDPSLPMAQLVLGRTLVETGDVNGGLPHLEDVLRMEPGNLEAHMTLAKAYSKLGRKEDARRERLLCLAISSPGTAPNATM